MISNDAIYESSIDGFGHPSKENLRRFGSVRHQKRLLRFGIRDLSRTIKAERTPHSFAASAGKSELAPRAVFVTHVLHNLIIRYST